MTQVQDDFRAATSAAIRDAEASIASDAAALFPYTGDEPLDADYCGRTARALVHLLVGAILDGGPDSRGALFAGARRLIRERAVSVDQLFAFMYHVERAALDELSVNGALGATTESWPLVTQIVRRASFDVLAQYAASLHREPSAAALVDPLTGLYTRPLFDAVLGKETERAGRFGYPVALILIGVDDLAAIESHGAGIGDRILERLGYLVRTYFRQHDWAARYSDDAIAVLLTRTDVDHAGDLAERLRETVEDRLGFVDHRTDAPVAVTVTVAIVSVQVERGGAIDAERLASDGERLLGASRKAGANRIVSARSAPAIRTPPRSSPSA